MNAKIVLMAMAAIASVSAHARGDKGGTGGGAHVCYRDSARKEIASVELYDLYEGRDHLSIPAWNGQETKAEILERALEKIRKSQPGFARDMRLVLAFMAKPGSVRNRELSRLASVDDLKQYSVGENCEYRQMINWLDPGEYAPGSGNIVLRDQTFYEKHLSPLDQAALDLHEAAYKVYRFYMPEELEKYGSIAVRNLIAEAFSDGKISRALVPSERIDDGFFGSIDRKNVWQGTFNVYDFFRASNPDCEKADVQMTVTNFSGHADMLVVYRPNNEKSKLRKRLRVSESTTLSLRNVDPGIEIKRPLFENQASSNSIRFDFEGCGLKGAYAEILQDGYGFKIHFKTIRPDFSEANLQ